jgi:exonuclease III
MSDVYYTQISYQSTIDHITVTNNLILSLYDLDAENHKAAVVEHNDLSISDHQPVYIWLMAE